ncbi:MAG: LysR family transcriptional regulator [Dehalococcoidia bacterium]
MELRHLELFVAVAEEGSFTRAGRRLHIVQSGVSASIHRLEQELGATLFLRTPRHAELTEAGRVLLIEARRTLAAARGAQEAVAAVQGLLQGTLTVGVHPHQRRGVDVATVLGRFHEIHPGVELRVRQVVSAVLMEELRDGHIDLGFAVLFGQPPAGITMTRLGHDSLVLVCGPRHRLADRQQIELEELTDEPFVTMHTDRLGTHTLVDDLFDSARIERRISARVNDLRFLLDLVAHGLGLAVVPQGDAAQAPNIHRLQLRAPMAEWDLVVATVGNPPPTMAARALLALVTSNITGASPGTE